MTTSKILSLHFFYSIGVKFLAFLVVFLIGTSPIVGQKSIEKALKTWNEGSVPYIHVDEIDMSTDFVLLDTRAKEEYAVSRLKDAIWVGYETFQIDSVAAFVPVKDAPIVVYCSIGVRSEDIGEKLQRLGYTNVKNLYGGIFQWKNQGKPVVDDQGNPTEKVHAFNKQWGKLLKKGRKVYE